MHKVFGAFALITCLTIILFGWRTLSYKKEEPFSTSIRHLAIIMDGNRRWAKERGLQPWIGHQQGIEPLKKTIKFCLAHHIPYLTLYAFSLENFKRSPEELQYLFEVVAQELIKNELEKLFEHNIKVCFIGDRSQFPAQLKETITALEAKSRHNTALTLVFLFCYGGRQEILDVIKRMMHDVHNLGNLQELSPEQIESYLWTNSLPDPDLIIRTGGMHRLSNFLPYQSAYSELCFLDCYWPDFSENDLMAAITRFEKTKRNFGA